MDTVIRIMGHAAAVADAVWVGDAPAPAPVEDQPLTREQWAALITQAARAWAHSSPHTVRWEYTESYFDSLMDHFRKS